jgi:hypothetical protein
MNEEEGIENTLMSWIKDDYSLFYKKNNRY